MKSWLIIIMLFSLNFLLCLEMEVLDFKGDPLDLHGSANKVLDANADACAVLRVECDLTQELHITDAEVYKKERKSEGVYYFYLSIHEKYLTFAAKSYMPLYYKLPVPNLLSSQTYVLKLRSIDNSAVDSLKYSQLVQFKIEPADAKIMIDGEIRNLNEPVNLQKGRHNVEIEKFGFVPLREIFTVSENTFAFSYKLSPAKTYPISITTSPDKAEVYLNDIRLFGSTGCTPIQDLFPAGKYRLKIIKPNYLTLESYIEIGEKTEQKTYVLQPDFGKLSLTSDPEINFNVFLNGNPVGKTPLSLENLKAGKYQITAQHELYAANPLNIVINPEDTLSFILKPEANYGTLSITVPANSEVYLNNVKMIELKNIKLPPQSISLQIKSPLSELVIDRFIINKGDSLYKEYSPPQAFGTINFDVYPPNSQIELTNILGFVKLLDSKSQGDLLPYGRYKVVIKNADYQTYSEEFELNQSNLLKSIQLEKRASILNIKVKSNYSAEQIDLTVTITKDNDRIYSGTLKKQFELPGAGDYLVEVRDENSFKYSEFVTVTKYQQTYQVSFFYDPKVSDRKEQVKSDNYEKQRSVCRSDLVFSLCNLENKDSDFAFHTKDRFFLGSVGWESKFFRIRLGASESLKIQHVYLSAEQKNLAGNVWIAQGEFVLGLPIVNYEYLGAFAGLGWCSGAVWAKTDLDDDYIYYKNNSYLTEFSAELRLGFVKAGAVGKYHYRANKVNFQGAGLFLGIRL